MKSTKAKRINEWTNERMDVETKDDLNELFNYTRFFVLKNV